jgi:aarF domain-containing kinase
VQETIKVARETGLRAGVVRSLQAGQALSRTLAEALPEIEYGRLRDPANQARLLRSLFERLGATYIKIGQLIASSPT